MGDESGRATRQCGCVPTKPTPQGLPFTLLVLDAGAESYLFCERAAPGELAFAPVEPAALEAGGVYSREPTFEDVAGAEV